MATPDEIRAWAREQGFKVADKGRIAGAVEEAFYAATGEVPPEVEQITPEPAVTPGGADPLSVFGTPASEIGKDPKSARSRQKARPGGGPVAAEVARDIQGKTAFMLTMPAMAWQARDPLCGAVMVQQVPDVSAALARLFCQSPEIVEWFTGKGGNFMAWLDLAAALQPVLMTVVQHHVLHSIGEQAEAEPPGMAQYAA